ncbi:hypothetical protein NOS3756_33710 [Nostoc sp. NIES-3756]|uniref:DUF4303 domain-containing protein n=1 Tax=Nostoc sp. NIES-3756 TaxID=1751286 RepID=UPI000722D109|nr:DUF4303 domain-containing protein [Nostoc sp. NIES-3756]BAT54402.1 hypothetical protein NOS3756_33710 [Nostoc sp. NIES-3756]
MTKEREQAFLVIRDAITTGIQNFLAAFRHDWANETMYGFLLEASWEGTSVEAVAATEEGLLRIAKYYTASEGKEDEQSINHQRIQLRWGSPEDGWYANYDANFFIRANQLLAFAHEAGLMELGDQQLQQLCLEVLRELDSAGVFANAETRPNIVVGVCDVGGDNTEEDFLQWAEAVNPPVVMERLRRELQEANEAYARSPSGGAEHRRLGVNPR